MKKFRLITGDCREELDCLSDESIDSCVTSPPYWSQRDYGVDGQIGHELLLERYIDSLIVVFDKVRRVLKQDGTLWLNLGDCYAGRPRKPSSNSGLVSRRGKGDGPSRVYTGEGNRPKRSIPNGLKEKDLVGLPWRVAFALQEKGWWLRSDIIWAKTNPMPESVRDRPTRSHEYVFLFSKSHKYFYDQSAIREESASGDGYRNIRDVWTTPTSRFKSAHFATFPPSLIKPCILAGCRSGGTVLDCFSGAGTTGLVAVQNQRRYVGIDICPAYNDLAEERLTARVVRPR